ncbi:alkaline phosphatase family protein [Candidatus Aminicenantes bacterium AC-708-M15]|jgi:predicted AlkP superfamily phosphohydrolase/phosphomutase|nr:alkaline phosphatase family protein [SCandidatus Aminicenantes bacterium Aminicenantia_JdfR_composite]MCP2598469.1 alkaline phosphatase family protein [Candidatus Aminicenantes bacterium AC-335-L06]MCP2604353.1 alkaline phosphatase family protein [Candidatus Aminicenantes bacterium AC-708-M15]MCP2605852.1 alkaline phosphatase family protein [Candidatus Aminicenantes bacterium AC-335-O07]MCP2606484.1 alkaline phosphatase family protein [Candidatus Aminicenantes bacterium AC-708-I09]MCP261902
MDELSRRDFLKIGLIGSAFLAVNTSGDFVRKIFGKQATTKKIIVLGFDGMDPKITKRLIDEGKLPYFKKLMEIGDFRPLRTSIPPQSPVAWSNFITGTDPGGHAIFDFIHRDPKNYLPYLSTSVTEPPKHNITIGNYVLPLSGGEVRLLRKGKAFWQILEEYDIPATIYKIPSNFPPAETKQRTLSGMGTPDILGTYGIFSYYTDRPIKLQEDIGGGEIYPVEVVNNKVHAQLIGPTNTFKKDKPKSKIDFTIYLDPEFPVAKIVIQGKEIILNEGEWSDWIKVKFDMIPTQSVSGICKFYLKEVRPYFKLYVTPINIDPSDPALPISTPENYCKELYEKFGYYWTKGLPADTKALDHGVLDEGEFLEQDDGILQERLRVYDYELNRFESGVLFFYISSTDQRQHMFWRLIDKNHPSYDEKLALKYGKTIENIYIEMDKILAETFKKLDKDTILFVMSDHGFSSFRRSFNLNTWLKENGYLKLINPWRQGEYEFHLNTDWSRTKAYALGLNSLFINLRGREKEGIVSPGAEADNLAEEIARKLKEVKDPETGERVIYEAYITKKWYKGPYINEAPDIIVGYNKGYRSSWQTALGKIPRKLFDINKGKWSGDHCMASELIPGILFTNKKIQKKNVSLYDLAPTILKIFGIKKPNEMSGNPIF